jgi:hypothetical protein
MTILVISSPLFCFRIGYSNLAMVGNGFVRICSDINVFVCGTLLVGKDVQPLQSVKPIRIAMSMVLNELWFGHIASVCGKDDFMV